MMTRTTVDIDDVKLAAAARELGTGTKKDTVDAALEYVATRGERARAAIGATFGDLFGEDIADPEIMIQARR